MELGMCKFDCIFAIQKKEKTYSRLNQVLLLITM